MRSLRVFATALLANARNTTNFLKVHRRELRVCITKKGICRVTNAARRQLSRFPLNVPANRSYFGEGEATSCFIGEVEFIGMPGEVEAIACVIGVP